MEYQKKLLLFIALFVSLPMWNMDDTHDEQLTSSWRKLLQGRSVRRFTVINTETDLRSDQSDDTDRNISNPVQPQSTRIGIDQVPTTPDLNTLTNQLTNAMYALAKLQGYAETNDLRLVATLTTKALEDNQHGTLQLNIKQLGHTFTWAKNNNSQLVEMHDFLSNSNPNHDDTKSEFAAGDTVYITQISPARIWGAGITIGIAAGALVTYTITEVVRASISHH